DARRHQGRRARQLPRVHREPRPRDRAAGSRARIDAHRRRLRADRLAAHADAGRFARRARQAPRADGGEARGAPRAEAHRRIRGAPLARRRRRLKGPHMPVAFHPPLAHAPDAAVAVRGKDDAVDADLFAALLSSAGAAGDVAGATRAAFAAFAGKPTKQAPDDLRGDDAHDRIPASTLDIAALAAFAAAAGVDLAQLAQHAAASPRASASPDASAAAHDATKAVVTKLAPAATPDARMAPSPENGAPAKDGTAFTLQQAGTTLPMPDASSAHGDTTPSRIDTRAATAAAARRDAVAALGAASTGEVHATAAAPSAATPGPVAALAQAALLAQAAGPAAS